MVSVGDPDRHPIPIDPVSFYKDPSHYSYYWEKNRICSNFIDIESTVAWVS